LQASRVRQAKAWNGAIGRVQLAWLEATCAAAAREGRRVIILCHHPVLPAADHNLWNAPEVVALLERQPAVVAWLNGHNHAGGFAEHHGVPCVTLHGMVETAGTSAFATARFLDDRLVITGHGREPSRELRFRS
jgi:3',5'-cyclic AMP phosphodiesterase CpdA